jgi:hypothetical protein
MMPLQGQQQQWQQMGRVVAMRARKQSMRRDRAWGCGDDAAGV